MIINNKLINIIILITINVVEYIVSSLNQGKIVMVNVVVVVNLCYHRLGSGKFG